MSTFILGPACFPSYRSIINSSTQGFYVDPSTLVAFGSSTSGTFNTPGIFASTSSADGATGQPTVATYPNQFGLIGQSYDQMVAGGRTPTSGNTNFLFDSGTFPLITFSTASATGKFNKFLAGGASGSTRLNIYSGTRPVNADALTSLDSVASNLLVSFSIPAFAQNNTTGFKLVNYDFFNNWKIELSARAPEPEPVKMVLGICPTRTAATATGTATWFWFGNYSSPSDLTGISYLTGSVGTVGSGSDLEMYSTNIQSGDLYVSQGFNFTIPLYYTV